MTGRVGVHPQRFVGVGGAVRQEPGAEIEGSLVLGVELGDGRHRQVEVELLGHPVVGPGRLGQLLHLLDGDPGGAGTVLQHQPVGTPRVALAGGRRLVAGAVREAEQLAVELGEQAGVGRIEHHLSEGREPLRFLHVITPIGMLRLTPWQHRPVNAEQAVAHLYQRLIDGWNSGDAAAMAGAIAPDGLVIGFDGSQMNGRAAVADELGRIFTDHETARYVTKIRKVWPLGEDVALLHAVAGMVPPGGEEIIAEQNAVQTVVAHRAAGDWAVALFQTTPAQLHGRPELSDALTAELNQLLHH